MTERVTRSGLQVAKPLADLLENAIAPGTGVDPADFWQGLAQLIADFGPRNRELLAIREQMQRQIDDWHRANPGRDYDRAAYRAFLEEIVSLQP